MALSKRLLTQGSRHILPLMIAAACCVSCNKTSSPKEEGASAKPSQPAVEKEPEPRFLKKAGPKTSWKVEIPELDDEAFTKMVNMYKDFAAFPDKSPPGRKRVEITRAPLDTSLHAVESAVELVQKHSYFDNNGMLKLFTDLYLIPNYRSAEFTLTLTSLVGEENKDLLSELSDRDKSRSPVWMNEYGSEKGLPFMGLDGTATAVSGKLKLKVPTKFAHYELDCAAGSVKGPAQKGIQVSGLRCLGGTVQIDVMGSPQSTTLDVFNKKGERLYQVSQQAAGLFEDKKELSDYEKWADVPKSYAGYRSRSTVEGKATRATLHFPTAFAEGEVEISYKKLENKPKLRFEADEGDPTYAKVPGETLDKLTVELKGSTALLTTDRYDLIVPLPPLANSAYAEVSLSDVVAHPKKGKPVDLGSLSLSIRDNLLAGSTVYKIDTPLESVQGRMKIRYPSSARLVEVKAPGGQGPAIFEKGRLTSLDASKVPSRLAHHASTWLRPLRAYDDKNRALALSRGSEDGVSPFFGPVASLKAVVVDSWYEAERDFKATPSEAKPEPEDSADQAGTKPSSPSSTGGSTQPKTEPKSGKTFIEKATTTSDTKNTVSAYMVAMKGHENLPKNGNAKVWGIKSRILACYDKAVAGESSKRPLSQLVIWLIIEANGSISNAGIRTDMTPPGVATCVLPLVRKLSFSPPAKGKMEGMVMSQFNLAPIKKK